jgi:hypothetical protein
MLDDMSLQGWSDFQAARRRFLDGLEKGVAGALSDDPPRLPAAPEEPDPVPSRNQSLPPFPTGPLAP